MLPSSQEPPLQPDEDVEDSSPVANDGGRKYVTIRKLAAILELSYPTTFKMVKSGRVKAIRIGGRYRIYEEEVWRLLNHGNRK